VPFEVTRRRLLALVPLMSGRRVVVAGDFVLDRFIYGHPRRVSREAPVVILRFSREDLLPGGAGNAAANVRSLGGEPAVVGIVGADDDGRALRRALSERGIDDRGLAEETAIARRRRVSSAARRAATSSRSSGTTSRRIPPPRFRASRVERAADRARCRGRCLGLRLRCGRTGRGRRSAPRRGR
jgi:hypothetical protein